MDKDRQLIERLADGRFHSGEILARMLGVSRTAVWKHLQAIATRYELEIHAVRGKGYRLPRPVELLSLPALEQEILPERRDRIAAIEVLDSVPSTNRYLAEGVTEWGGEAARVCLAERQTQGRGRRGRIWVSPYAANLYLSVYWPFDLPMAALNGLSLAMGVAVVQALERLGVDGAALKWPNDIHVDERKLGGILVEVFGQTAGPVAAIVGVGLNIQMPPGAGSSIDQEWTDLGRVLPGSGGRTGRNRLAGLVIDELVRAAVLFTSDGWPAFESAWHRHDGYRGRAVEVHTSRGTEQGIYLGVDADGGLVLEQGDGRTVFHAGDVSLRTIVRAGGNT